MPEPKQILIIDDEDSIREIVKACLEDIGGWQTVTADSGQAGLIAARQHTFDAILLDISMPDTDGFEIFEQLQQATGGQSAPVILLTAKVLPEDQARFNTMAIAGIIHKPFNPLTLSRQIARLLGWS